MGGPEILLAFAEADPVTTNHVRVLVAALRQAGARVSVLCAFEASRHPDRTFKAIESNAGVWIEAPLSHPLYKSSTEAATAFANLAAEIAERRGWRPDVVHAHDAISWPVARRIGSMTSARRVMSFHNPDLIIEHHGFPPPHREQLELERQAAAEADAIIAPSRAVAELVAELGSDLSAISIAYLPPAFDDLAAPDPELRSRFALDGETVVVMAGRPSPLSGLRELCAVVASEQGRERKLRAIVVGALEWMIDFFELPPVEDLANVAFLPWLEVEQRRALYAIADVAVIPSLVGASAEIPVEIFAAGLPAACTDLEVHAELLGNVSWPWLARLAVDTSVAPRALDPGALGDALVELPRAGAEERASRAETARAELAGSVSRERFVADHMAAYGLASGRGQRPAGVH